MKPHLTTLFCLLTAVLTFASGGRDLTANFQQGDPEIKSINALAFGPEGIIFLGDSKNARVFAIATN
ncbi:MAG: hypothetical protein RJQ14_08075, partial [Marinoscillum sp.]